MTDVFMSGCKQNSGAIKTIPIVQLMYKLFSLRLLIMKYKEWQYKLNVEYLQVAGLETNVNFLLRLSGASAFVDGDVHTAFIPQHEHELFPKSDTVLNERRAVQAALGHVSTLQVLENHKISNCPLHWCLYQIVV